MKGVDEGFLELPNCQALAAFGGEGGGGAEGRQVILSKWLFCSGVNNS